MSKALTVAVNVKGLKETFSICAILPVASPIALTAWMRTIQGSRVAESSNSTAIEMAPNRAIFFLMDMGNLFTGRAAACMEGK